MLLGRVPFTHISLINPHTSPMSPSHNKDSILPYNAKQCWLLAFAILPSHFMNHIIHELLALKNMPILTQDHMMITP